MIARRLRIPVVLDTNVFVRNFKARRKNSPNRRVVRLWLVEKKLQLVVSAEILAEYLEIFQGLLGFHNDLLREWRERLTDDGRSTLVKLGPRFKDSPDPDDNVFLATAAAGRVEYLVTNDTDLLDLPISVRKRLPFEIVTPRQLLKDIGD